MAREQIAGSFERGEGRNLADQKMSRMRSVLLRSSRLFLPPFETIDGLPTQV